jgi:hypothetical protein
MLNKPDDKRFELADRDGLSVRVTETGLFYFNIGIDFSWRSAFNIGPFS